MKDSKESVMDQANAVYLQEILRIIQKQKICLSKNVRLL